jgi:hypothetical protein
MKMSKINQKIELTANILIIVVAVLLIGVIAQRYLFAPSADPNRPTRVQPTVGTKINLPATDWSGQSKTLIIALQKGCRFCSESAPFYKRLQESVRDKNVKLVAVLPGTQEESAGYLNQLGLTNLEVKQSPLNALQTSGTPTLILVNDKGEVTHFWVGKLPADKEDEVINQLNS